ncbi:hypothetical protein DTO027B5_4426 [Paecilomyces variotii]|nr:hypothetical protein DTO169C6_1443 [Paecilomyces variotii]KAJ9258395.1 hypothetical protein DTO207G8_1570 [Paecilomyces variotii]KAJ9289217.1 hypothetical protein DTO021C3_3043 [Paecilomyces variotii]KAJ9329274.1 hypothetical protein DTO027B3_674 [Paecilomyces variotii]KAJ9333857.1 hypothetical protein DTO027B5_4426 [Paecilomyces variotii]
MRRTVGTAPRLPSPFPERHHFSSLRISAYQLEPDVLCEEKSSQEDSLAVGVLNFAVVFMVSGMRTGRASRLRKASVF